MNAINTPPDDESIDPDPMSLVLIVLGAAGSVASLLSLAQDAYQEGQTDAQIASASYFIQRW